LRRGCIGRECTSNQEFGKWAIDPPAVVLAIGDLHAIVLAIGDPHAGVLAFADPYAGVGRQ
jgi:hypothetical protein